jgi:hypothetical protein
MINRYYIIDDFYNDPDELVRVSLESAINFGSNGNFAGVMTSQAFLSIHQRDLFQKLLLEPSIDSSTQLNGKVRFTKEGDPYKQNIHFDGGFDTKWSGVVYLSKNHPNVDGTAFWKHKKSGLEEIPRTEAGLAKVGLNSREGIKNLLEKDGIDETQWEKTLAVPYRYNRLVLFRPWLFHSPGVAWGNTLQTSRIVQTIFLGNAPNLQT